MPQATRAVPYTEIAMRVLAAGSIDPIAEMKDQVARRSLTRAVLELRRLGRPDLAHAVEKEFCNGGKCGKPPPRAGDKRKYRVQCHANGEQDFVRIPTITLRRGKGSLVDVHFQAGRIIITPGPEALHAQPADPQPEPT